MKEKTHEALQLRLTAATNGAGIRKYHYSLTDVNCPSWIWGTLKAMILH